MNDLPSLVRAVTAEAYELANKSGRLPERINVQATFDMDHSGRLRLNQSRGFPRLINVKRELAPREAPPGLRLIADHVANKVIQMEKKNTGKRVKLRGPVLEASWVLCRSQPLLSGQESNHRPCRPQSQKAGAATLQVFSFSVMPATR